MFGIKMYVFALAVFPFFCSAQSVHASDKSNSVTYWQAVAISLTDTQFEKSDKKVDLDKVRLNIAYEGSKIKHLNDFDMITAQLHQAAAVNQKIIDKKENLIKGLNDLKIATLDSLKTLYPYYYRSNIMNESPNEPRVSSGKGSVKVIKKDKAETGAENPLLIRAIFNALRLHKSEYENFIANYKWEYTERKEIRDEGKKFFHHMISNSPVYYDSFIEDYIYSRIQTIIPEGLPEERWSHFRVVLISEAVPNAYVTEDGTIYLNTGLLALMESESELDAILAHEIAHVVLDHNFLGYKKTKKNEKTGSILGALAASAVMVGAAYHTSKIKDPSLRNKQAGQIGALAPAAIYSGAMIGKSIGNLLGMKYNRDQELAADAAARGWLSHNGKEVNSLSLALKRIKGWNLEEKFKDDWSWNSSHPKLSQRIDIVTEPPKNVKEKYDEKIHGALIDAAHVSLLNNDIPRANRYVKRSVNISNPSSDALALYATINRRSGNTSKDTLFRYVDLALKLDPNNINALQESVIIGNRFDDKARVKSALNTLQENEINAFDRLRSRILGAERN